jgi:NTP pyrophosphatase (non-canonical NTP hydrolase)
MTNFTERPEDTIRRLVKDSLWGVQNESNEWRQAAYPDTVHDNLAQLAGVTEEVGELAHALLKYKQGIRGYDRPRMLAEAGDAMADAIIYMCGIASSLGLDLQHEVLKAWHHVRDRNITQNSDAGDEAPPGMVLDTMSARQLGHLTPEEHQLAITQLKPNNYPNIRVNPAVVSVVKELKDAIYVGLHDTELDIELSSGETTYNGECNIADCKSCAPGCAH